MSFFIFLDLENSLKLANAHGNATVEEIRAALKKYPYRIQDLPFLYINL
jgi:hypothetical protein